MSSLANEPTLFFFYYGVAEMLHEDAKTSDIFIFFLLPLVFLLLFLLLLLLLLLFLSISR